ncbi:DUF6291 domain-containing protein [Riemerella anatipestifer]|uniref:primosomal protein n=1 Tax=Riemerella phage RAP44 TaxID=936152 RepID=UPI0002078593|nr:DUF6291 domain-containing protein [Riemerella anatipestifer]YP_007003657.1 primosomal protein [Riemerella phage RAP44]AEB71644.1 phage replication protein [Riemerella phage RAP44]MCU7542962.1 DUF6291 domain-containing protein [Riemerella anatipestifer]MCW0513679.1 DUF6291 domain-containing protein [Riemerella anatipestifer]
MGDTKKSFVIHLDMLNVLDELDDKQAGRLLKAIREYQLRLVEKDHQDTDAEGDWAVNDFVTKIVFAPFKAQFDRDYSKWVETSEKNRKNARKRWDNSHTKNTTRINRIPNNAKNADSVSDSVNDNVNVNDDNVLLEKEPKGGFVSDTEDLESDKSIEPQKRKKVAAKKEKFDFRQAMLNEGFDEELIDEWLRIRKKKKAVDSEMAFKLITSQIEKAKLEKNEILKIIVRKQWKGFEAKWLDENKNENERNYNSISNSNTTGGYKKSQKVSAHALLAERLSKSTSRDDHSGTIDAEFEVV